MTSPRNTRLHEDIGIWHWIRWGFSLIVNVGMGNENGAIGQAGPAFCLGDISILYSSQETPQPGAGWECGRDLYYYGDFVYQEGHGETARQSLIFRTYLYKAYKWLRNTISSSHCVSGLPKFLAWSCLMLLSYVSRDWEVDLAQLQAARNIRIPIISIINHKYIYPSDIPFHCFIVLKYVRTSYFINPNFTLHPATTQYFRHQSSCWSRLPIKLVHHIVIVVSPSATDSPTD